MKDQEQSISTLIERLQDAQDPADVIRSWLAEHQQEEIQLRDSEARLRAILNTTVDGVVTANTDGIIESFNSAAERIFGYASDEVVGQNVSMLMPSPFRESHDAYMRHYLTTGEAKIIGIGRETIALRKEGTTFPVDLAVSEVNTQGRKLFTAIVRDITERKRLEEAIVAVSELEREQVGQELHDALGQQLTGIALLAKALERTLNDSGSEAASEAAGIAELARKAVTEAKRLSHGLYPTQLEKHGLSSALEEMADAHQRVYHISCEYESEEKIPSFDRSTSLHLYRIAQEATNNATKHSQASKITIRLYRREGNITLTIEDDGVGIVDIDPDHMGMGLAIMKYRASMIGGILKIDTGPGQGTRIICEL